MWPKLWAGAMSAREQTAEASRSWPCLPEAFPETSRREPPETSRRKQSPKRPTHLQTQARDPISSLGLSQPFRHREDTCCAAWLSFSPATPSRLTVSFELNRDAEPPAAQMLARAFVDESAGDPGRHAHSASATTPPASSRWWTPPRASLSSSMPPVRLSYVHHGEHASPRAVPKSFCCEQYWQMTMRILQNFF